MKIFYNACKNPSCKIIHATHAKLGATKSKQSRRNCEIKQKLYEQLLYLATENKNKLYGGATTNYKKKQRSGVLHILHRKKNCQFLQYGRHWAEFGVLCLE
jgi:hypothetical protein